MRAGAAVEAPSGPQASSSTGRALERYPGTAGPLCGATRLLAGHHPAATLRPPRAREEGLP